MLGAGATAVGFVAGFGELIGYAVRFASGYLSDRTGRYWAVTIFGYCVNSWRCRSWRWPALGKPPLC